MSHIAHKHYAAAVAAARASSQWVNAAGQGVHCKKQQVCIIALPRRFRRVSGSMGAQSQSAKIKRTNSAASISHRNSQIRPVLYHIATRPPAWCSSA